MRFAARDSFVGAPGYRLLPLRFRRLPWDTERVVATSLSGDWLTMSRSALERLTNGSLESTDPLFADLEARHFLTTDSARTTLAPLINQYKARKGYLQKGPALHIFVVSLRCHHTCAYCQVSRRPTGDVGFDMAGTTGGHAIDRLFEWPARTLTVEFQGGEPLLHFDRVRYLAEQITERNKSEGRTIRFVIASTLHDLTQDQLLFMRDHDFKLSTSLDGPEWLHNANRPRPERDSYRRTIEGIENARKVLGKDAVSALTTLTAKSLEHPIEIIDEYRAREFHSIFLRPLSPYGFARKTQHRNGYSIAEFLNFYEKALDHILAANKNGYSMDEVYASLLLSALMTPYSHGYVDLRSPTGAGLGAVVYDYDGYVYPSDEARMLASMGDKTFALGRINQPIGEWLRSSTMRAILEAGVAEALPTCVDCAYVPWCGADPIDHYARQGDLIGHRPSSDFCAKQMGMFDLLMRRWEQGSVSDRALFETWALRSQQAAPALQEAA